MYYIFFDDKYLSLLKKTMHRQATKWKVFKMKINFQRRYLNILWSYEISNVKENDFFEISNPGYIN